MKRFMMLLVAVVFSFGGMIEEAEAKRFGGAKSSGISRSQSVMQRDAIPPKAATAPTQAGATAAAPPASGMSRWLGPVAGLAAGIGLASLFSHLGMGEGMATLFMLLALGMLAMFVVRKLLSKRQTGGGLQPAMSHAGTTPAGAARSVNDAVAFRSAANSMSQASPAPTDGSNIPAGFDVEAFLRQAKLNFIRLQAANDRGDMDDIREFCTPEMAAEIQLQIQERAGAAQQTDVVYLNAELLDVSTEGQRAVASVRFSGELREATEAAPEAFSEVWHLSKPLDGSRGWCVAGIQQD